MTLRYGDMKKSVTLEQVEAVLKKLARDTSNYGYHTIDLGEAGYVDVDCDVDNTHDTEEVLERLSHIAE